LKSISEDQESHARPNPDLVGGVGRGFTRDRAGAPSQPIGLPVLMKPAAALPLARDLIDIHEQHIFGASWEARKSIYRATNPGAKVRTQILFQSRLKS
jgi:hypothetical protein